MREVSFEMSANPAYKRRSNFTIGLVLASEFT